MIRVKLFMMMLLTIFISILVCIFFTNIQKGIISGGIFGLVIFLSFCLISFVFNIFTKKTSKKFNLVINVTTVITLIVFHSYFWNPSGVEIFKKTLNTNELPTSLTIVNSCVDYIGKDPFYRIKFNIDDVDLHSLLFNFHEYRTHGPKKKDNLEDLITIEDGLLYNYNVGYLYKCKTEDWWPIEKIIKLPLYQWHGNNFLISLWIYKNNDDEKTTVFATR